METMGIRTKRKRIKMGVTELRLLKQEHEQSRKDHGSSHENSLRLFDKILVASIKDVAFISAYRQGVKEQKHQYIKNRNKHYPERLDYAYEMGRLHYKLERVLDL